MGIAGRGYVRVSENEDFEVLHPPFQMKDVLEEGDHYEGYIMSVYHQLHCLVREPRPFPPLNLRGLGCDLLSSLGLFSLF